MFMTVKTQYPYSTTIIQCNLFMRSYQLIFLRIHNQLWWNIQGFIYYSRYAHLFSYRFHPCVNLRISDSNWDHACRVLTYLLNDGFQNWLLLVSLLRTLQLCQCLVIVCHLGFFQKFQLCGLNSIAPHFPSIYLSGFWLCVYHLVW